MALLFIFSIIFIANNGFDLLVENFSRPLKNGSIMNALFLGFSAAMLGVTGFESTD